MKSAGTTMHHEHYLCTDAAAHMVLWLEEKPLALVLLADVLSCPQVMQTLKEDAAPSTDQEMAGRKPAFLCVSRVAKRTAMHNPIGRSSVFLFNMHYCIVFQSLALTAVRLLVIDEVFYHRRVI